MIKKRSLLIFVMLPLIAGYLVASIQGHTVQRKSNLNFASKNVLPTDRITLVNQGSISSVTKTDSTTIDTHHPQLIEASPLGNNYIAVDKQTNYASLEEFSSTGVLLETLLNGNTKDIDTMNWFIDPAVQQNQQEIVFVSDKDKEKTKVFDNALFIYSLASHSIKRIVDPFPSSGGIAHPRLNPTNPNILIYDYYQYDEKYNPYSLIQEYNRQTEKITSLTTQKQNAYQGSFSSDGKQLIFLGRNSDFTVTMYLADVADNGLSNVQKLMTGDIAYPTFSFTSNHIYYLQAEDNKGYNLLTATVQKNKLINPATVVSGFQLLGNASFSVTPVHQ